MWMPEEADPENSTIHSVNRRVNDFLSYAGCNHLGGRILIYACSRPTGRTKTPKSHMHSFVSGVALPKQFDVLPVFLASCRAAYVRTQSSLYLPGCRLAEGRLGDVREDSTASVTVPRSILLDRQRNHFVRLM